MQVVFEEQYVCIILPVHILFDQADLLLLFFALPCCSLWDFPIWQTYSSVHYGPYFSHDSHIVLFVVLVMFCTFTLPYECTTLFDHPFIGKVSSNAFSTVTKHFFFAIKHFVVVELGIFVLLPCVFRVDVL